MKLHTVTKSYLGKDDSHNAKLRAAREEGRKGVEVGEGLKRGINEGGGRWGARENGMMKEKHGLEALAGLTDMKCARLIG